MIGTKGNKGNGSLSLRKDSIVPLTDCFSRQEFSYSYSLHWWAVCVTLASPGSPNLLGLWVKHPFVSCALEKWHRIICAPWLQSDCQTCARASWIGRWSLGFLVVLNFIPKWWPSRKRSTSSCRPCVGNSWWCFDVLVAFTSPKDFINTCKKNQKSSCYKVHCWTFRKHWGKISVNGKQTYLPCWALVCREIVILPPPSSIFPWLLSNTGKTLITLWQLL